MGQSSENGQAEAEFRCSAAASHPDGAIHAAVKHEEANHLV